MVTIQKTDCSCLITLVGHDSNWYVQEEQTPIKEYGETPLKSRDVKQKAVTNEDLHHYKYTNTVSLVYLYKVDANGNRTLLNTSFEPYQDGDTPFLINMHDKADRFTFTLPTDGHYVFGHIILPTKQALALFGLTDNTIDDVRQITGEDMSSLLIFAYDCDLIVQGTWKWDGYAYRLTWKQITDYALLIQILEQEAQDVTIKQVTKNNDVITIRKKVTPGLNATARVSLIDWFSYCILYRQYIDKAKDLLSLYNEAGFCDECKSKEIKNLDIATRDYLWMAINVIKYCIDRQDYDQAQKTLNCVSTCSDKTNNGCGCTKN